MENITWQQAFQKKMPIPSGDELFQATAIERTYLLMNFWI